jgi:hypothetical protein
LISVPGRLDDPSAKTVLEDELGAKDIKRWRLFDYINGNYVEYPGTRDFSASRSLFLIVKTGTTIDANAGTFVQDSVFTVDLAAGWNLVANPYNLSIPISALSLASSDPRNLITFEGTWSSPVNSLEPWKGYAIKVNNATTLTIRPNFPGTVALAKSSTLEQAEESQTSWSIQIMARCQEARDENNFAGLASAAATEWDALDLYEPPSIGEYVAVSFPHENWPEHADRYTTDFRPPVSSNEGYVWEMAIRSNIHDRVELTFAQLQEVPSEVQVYLVDEPAGIAQDLRADSHYSLLPLAGSTEKRLKLVAGPSQYVEKTIAALAPAPSTYELFQNYPNPFNPETAIRFGLPEKRRVTLKIFDLAGREVITLLANEEFAAGRYERFWNGRDAQGRPVVSGVYFYRLMAASFTKTLKLTLLR